jgi:hypothetical protein
MSKRRIPISDAAVLARLEAGEIQQALADDLGVSRWAVRNARDRQLALRQRVVEGKAVTTKARKLERRRAKRKGSANPETRPGSASAPSSKPAATRPALARTTIYGDAASGRWGIHADDGSGQPMRIGISAGKDEYSEWLDGRDRDRAANTPAAHAAVAEQDRLDRIARLGYDPCVPGEAAAYLARRA